MKQKSLVLVFIAIAITLSAVRVHAQMEKPKAEKEVWAALKEKVWFKIVANFSIHKQYPELEKACCKILFKTDSLPLQAAFKEHLNTYEKVQSPEKKMVYDDQKEEFTIRFENGVEGKYLCYFVNYKKLWVGENMAHSRNRTRNIIYDVVHNKVLTLEDVLVPEKVEEVKSLIGDAFPQMGMNDKRLSVGCMKQGKLMAAELKYLEYPDAFTDQFKQLLNWDEIDQALKRAAAARILSQANQVVGSSEKVATNASVIDVNKVYDVVEHMPEFAPCTYEVNVYNNKGKVIGVRTVNCPGGQAGLLRFISDNLKYPAIAEENGIQGRVVCTFVVGLDGTVSDVQVARSIDPSLDKEALRVLKGMPRWNPGIHNGQPVRVKYTVPVTFKLQ